MTITYDFVYPNMKDDFTVWTAKDNGKIIARVDINPFKPREFIVVLNGGKTRMGSSEKSFEDAVEVAKQLIKLYYKPSLKARRATPRRKSCGCRR